MKVSENKPNWTQRGQWKLPHSADNETSVASFGLQFPVRKLIKIEARGLGAHDTAFEGAHGRRSASRCLGGSFSGGRLAGSVAEDVSNEWRLHTASGNGDFVVEGMVTLLADTGETILMKYLGRGGERYGNNSYRIGAVFEAPIASLNWLNSICAAGRVHIDGNTLRFEMFELLGRPGAESGWLDVEPLYRMTGLDSVGERLTIHGAVANRYLTMAEKGCRVQGRLDGMWMKGISWGPHRMAFTPSSLPWQIDMKVLMQAQSGVPVLQQYLGTIPDRSVPGADPDDASWRTAAVFETDIGSDLGWLNGVVAIGIGWKERNEAHYHYYILR